MRLLIITSAFALALHAQTPAARAGDCDNGIDADQFQDNGWKPKDKNDKKPPHRLKKAECPGCQKFVDDLQKALDDCYAKQLEDIGDIDYSAPGAEEKQKKKTDAKDALGGAKEAEKAKAPKGKSQQDLKDEVKKKWEALKGQLGRCKESPYPGLRDLVTLPEYQPPPRGTPTPSPTPTPTPQEHGMAPRQPGKTGETCAVLIATGKIKVETSGTGETIGHIADLKIQNLTDQPLTCAVPPMILESISRKNQDYVCPTPQTVTIDPHRTTTVPVNGVCINRNKPPVGKGAPGDLVVNTGDPSVPQNPDSHIPVNQARDLLRICTAKYNAADQLQKNGALKALPYKDKQKQKDIVVQWSTWCDPRISQITGAPPATKEDLRKVVYKQVQQHGPMSPETKKKVDQGIDTIFEKVELTTAKAKDLEKSVPLPPAPPPPVPAETFMRAPTPTPTPTPTVTPTPDEQSLKDCLDAAKKKKEECMDEADKRAERCRDKCKKDFPIRPAESAAKLMSCLDDCRRAREDDILDCKAKYAEALEDCIEKHLAEGQK